MPRTLTLEAFLEAMTVEELFRLVGTVEHEQLDFKRGVSDDLKKNIPAMSMTEGGVLILGVADDRSVVGCPLSQHTQDRITRFANECNVQVALRSVTVGQHTLTLVQVPKITDRIVTTPDGRLLQRVGGDCVPLTGDAMARFVRSRTHRSAEDQVWLGFDLRDVDRQVLNEALSKAGGAPAADLDGVGRALLDLKVAEPDAQGRPLVLGAAVVLFANHPERSIPGATVQLVRRVGVGPGPGPAHGRSQLSGPLPLVLQDALDWIEQRTSAYQVVVGRRRETLPEYPVAVLREALLNALAHRDYGLQGATVDVTLWDDRVEIRSPGPLPGHITVDNMRTEHYSRNRRLMGVLRTLGFVEEFGEGVDRMVREMEARLMEPPIFHASDSSVTVTLRNRFLVDPEDQAWLALLGQYQLSVGERRALVIAHREGSVTPRQLRRVLGEEAVSELLNAAVTKGLLVRIGERGATRYELSDEVVLRAGHQGLEAQSRKRQLLLDEARRAGSLSTAEGAALLGEDQAVARHLLNNLVSAGLLEARGRTRARRYLPVLPSGAIRRG